MDVLYLLIPLSLVLVFVIGLVFWLALRGGQFDDLDGPAIRVVLDDDRPQQAVVAPLRAVMASQLIADDNLLVHPGGKCHLHKI